MNERFLSRAWHKDYGEMVYSKPDFEFGKRDFSPFVFEVGFSIYPKDDYWIIMQCTGLKDKNGKLTFDADILCAQDGINGNNGSVFWEVFWSKEYAGWFCLCGDDVKPLWEIIEDGAIICGNIHDTSELLEGGDET
jgi:uncharacterized phage protein (TIGR01671 family)